MGRLKVFSGEELCQLLESNGFKRVRQKGSHLIMQKVEEETTNSVPVPMHKEIKIGTLQSVIRQSGLSRALFETN